MKLYCENNNYKLYNGNMLELNDVINNNTIDAIVTDPPYELGFMGRSWDSSGIAFQKETWEKCFNALKPGGYLLAFGGSRTFHRIACAIEDAGFEIRDTIIWLYGSGFPKSMNIGLAIDKKNGVESEVIGYSNGTMPDFKDAGEKNSINKIGYNDGISCERKESPIYKVQNEWSGWGTCLKPSYEPIIVARKPCEGACVDNVLKWGVGGINIDECRVETSDYLYSHGSKNGTANSICIGNFAPIAKGENASTGLGRFPANTILTYDETDFDEVCGGFPIGGKNGSITKQYKMNNQVYGEYGHCNTWEAYDDEGSAARYFYCAKASKRDRDEGLDLLEDKYPASAEFRPNHMEKALNGENGNPYGRWQPRKNIHPTVKPTSLMQYLVRLVAPNGATILDPFMGSGSTGKAVMYENNDNNKDYKFIGIELTDEYLPIAQARISYASGDKEKLPIDNKEEKAYNKEEESKPSFEKFDLGIF